MMPDKPELILFCHKQPQRFIMGLSQTSSITPDISLLAAVVASNHLNTSGTSHTSTLPLPSCSIDESYKYVFLPVCYSLTFLFSLTLNSVVLLRSCCHHGRRWNTSLIYMVNLATTDLMYGLSLPFLVASYVLRDCWVFGDFMCRLVRFLFYFNLYCSIFFLTCISVHRQDNLETVQQNENVKVYLPHKCCLNFNQNTRKSAQ